MKICYGIYSRRSFHISIFSLLLESGLVLSQPCFWEESGSYIVGPRSREWVLGATGVSVFSFPVPGLPYQVSLLVSRETSRMELEPDFTLKFQINNLFSNGLTLCTLYKVVYSFISLFFYFILCSSAGIEVYSLFIKVNNNNYLFWIINFSKICVLAEFEY